MSTVIVCATVYVLDHTIGVIRITTSGSSVVRTLKHPPYRLVVERAVQCRCSKAILVDPEVHTKDTKIAFTQSLCIYSKTHCEKTYRLLLPAPRSSTREGSTNAAQVVPELERWVKDSVPHVAALESHFRPAVTYPAPQFCSEPGALGQSSIAREAAGFAGLLVAVGSCVVTLL